MKMIRMNIKGRELKNMMNIGQIKMKMQKMMKIKMIMMMKKNTMMRKE
jgi:hypothetical protein